MIFIAVSAFAFNLPRQMNKLSLLPIIYLHEYGTNINMLFYSAVVRCDSYATRRDEAHILLMALLSNVNIKREKINGARDTLSSVGAGHLL